MELCYIFPVAVHEIERYIKPGLTETEVDELLLMEPGEIRWAFLEITARWAHDREILESSRTAEISPYSSVPSGQIPVYEKPNVNRRRGKVGAKEGHLGTRRKTPERIDEEKEHALEKCPCCGEALEAAFEERERITEDIPEVKSIVTKHIIKRCVAPFIRGKRGRACRDVAQAGEDTR